VSYLAFAGALLAILAWTTRDDGPVFRLSLWALVVVVGLMLAMALLG
jgi:hypothetical protein